MRDVLQTEGCFPCRQCQGSPLPCGHPSLLTWYKQHGSLPPSWPHVHPQCWQPSTCLFCTPCKGQMSPLSQAAHASHPLLLHWPTPRNRSSKQKLKEPKEPGGHSSSKSGGGAAVAAALGACRAQANCLVATYSLWATGWATLIYINR